MSDTNTLPLPQLNLDDLAAVVNLIDIVSRRGAFEGKELASIGMLRGKFVDFIEAHTPKPTETTVESPTETTKSEAKVESQITDSVT